MAGDLDQELVRAFHDTLLQRLTRDAKVHDENAPPQKWKPARPLLSKIPALGNAAKPLSPTPAR